MRLFVAINLPPEERDRIHGMAEDLRDQGYPFRWVRADLLHLTLKFLGDVRGEDLGRVQDALDRVAGSAEPFPMTVGGLGAFPTLRRPRVLWVGVEASPALRCLKQDLEWAFSDQGFERETRAFHPHLTLGRVRNREGAGAFRGLDEVASRISYQSRIEVEGLDLMESHLSSKGPTYEIRSTHPLSSE